MKITSSGKINIRYSTSPGVGTMLKMTTGNEWVNE